MDMVILQFIGTISSVEINASAPLGLGKEITLRSTNVASVTQTLDHAFVLPEQKR